MNLKQIFKTVEGIAMLGAFGMIILTGSKMFACLGLAAYIVINLKGGLNTVKSLWGYIKNKLKRG